MALFEGKEEAFGNAILITHRGIFSQLANSGLLTVVDAFLKFEQLMSPGNGLTR